MIMEKSIGITLKKTSLSDYMLESRKVFTCKTNFLNNHTFQYTNMAYSDRIITDQKSTESHKLR